jgi:uncharacterized protein (TIGR03083 family)
MVDYLQALADESQWFGDAVTGADFEAPVPSCPGWKLADLIWHLAEVQYFWAAIAEGPLMKPELVADLTRPEPSLLRGLFNEQAARLHRALSASDPATPCWTWKEDDQTIGFVRRRQAHEALIHRVDAELTVGTRTPIDADLAVDGVDEILRVQIDGFPAWGTFTEDGVTATITETNNGRSWGLVFGRFTGTSPNTHTDYDLDALTVVDAAVLEPKMHLRGSAADLDLWLWGRATADALQVHGDDSLVARLRTLAAESTD